MAASPEWEFEWIAESGRLESVSEELRAEPILSLDTETSGWQTGNEKLALIQIGVPSKKKVFLIDPLAIETLIALEPVMASKTPELVIHNAPFEERQFRRHAIKLKGVIDTLELSRRLRPDLPSHSLRMCCRLILDLKITKEEQSSDWSRRPLTDEQLAYARLDAEVTMKLYSVLAAMETQLIIDPNAEVPVLMGDLWETLRKKLELTSQIAAELALLQARETMLRENIRAKLVDGAPAYAGEYGTAEISQVKRTEINPERVREVFPTLADRVISETVERKRLLAVMKEFGIDEGELEQVLEVSGFYDRMFLKVADVV